MYREIPMEAGIKRVDRITVNTGDLTKTQRELNSYPAVNMSPAPGLELRCHRKLCMY